MRGPSDDGADGQIACQDRIAERTWTTAGAPGSPIARAIRTCNACQRAIIASTVRMLAGVREARGKLPSPSACATGQAGPRQSPPAGTSERPKRLIVGHADPALGVLDVDRSDQAAASLPDSLDRHPGERSRRNARVRSGPIRAIKASARYGSIRKEAAPSRVRQTVRDASVLGVNPQAVGRRRSRPWRP